MSTTEQLLETIKSVRNILSSKHVMAHALLNVLWCEKKQHIPNLDEISEIVREHGEIVRCGECQFARKVNYGQEFTCHHMSHAHCKIDFCSYGKRKEGDNGK